MNGEDKGDSGVETQNSEGNADDECDPLGPNCYYDKSKSFFDNISCDDTRYESTSSTSSHCPDMIKMFQSVTVCLFCSSGKLMTSLEAQLSHGECLSRHVTDSGQV